MRIHLDGVSVSPAGDVPILRDLTLTLEPSWTALVGANGAGKTTLLRLLAGECAPVDGSVARSGVGKVSLVPQRVEHLAEEVCAFAMAWDGEAMRLRGRFALEEGDLRAVWGRLSPGQRKRWQVAAALWARPDVLLLDEASNHLDAEALREAGEALRSFRGIGVVVSHDRAFLRLLASRTVLLHQGTASAWACAPDVALDEHERQVQGALDERSRAQEESRALLRRAQAAEERRASAERSRSRRVRGGGRADSDARSIGAGNLADWAAGRAARDAGRASARLRAAAERLDAMAAVPHHSNSSFRIEGKPSHRNPLFVCRQARVEVGGRALLQGLELTLRPDERVHVRGANGSGKTTLLGWIHARLLAEGVDALWMPQELTCADEAALLDQLHARPPEARGRALHIVSALGTPPPEVLHARVLSPGLGRKLWLALSLTQSASALLLDEPTNHLDLPAIRALQHALEGWPAALLLVTHDDAFAQACTGTVWEVGGGVRRVPPPISPPCRGRD